MINESTRQSINNFSKIVEGLSSDMLAAIIKELTSEPGTGENFKQFQGDLERDNQLELQIFYQIFLIFQEGAKRFVSAHYVLRDPRN